MRSKTTLSEIDAQIERLREKRRLLLSRANERFARAAAKAGLAELEIPDADLDAIFEEIAARYRSGGKGSSGASA
ncbi:TraC family protein [Brucella pseudogrignonensis]|uniref:TraC family protein n=1 Tax=Brucella pseudogrignonensis TaxID=419475 RepID=UPI00124C81D0|nr:TraC family protein [Brucella pseudogrignonensis]KAB2689493.1 pilus assembly protein [Brucella pseudogrignonensis]